jgi:chromosome segregation ATPase
MSKSNAKKATTKEIKDPSGEKQLGLITAIIFILLGAIGGAAGGWLIVTSASAEEFNAYVKSADYVCESKKKVLQTEIKLATYKSELQAKTNDETKALRNQLSDLRAQLKDNEDKVNIHYLMKAELEAITSNWNSEISSKRELQKTSDLLVRNLRTSANSLTSEVDALESKNSELIKRNEHLEDSIEKMVFREARRQKQLEKKPVGVPAEKLKSPKKRNPIMGLFQRIRGKKKNE